VVAWVEHGVAPPHMQWEIDADNALVLPDDAATRGGIQPVAHATANGATCAEVKVGEPVTLRATATVPPGTGTIVVAAWDFDESATWPHHHPEADGSSDTIDVTVTHTYDAPGTYFAAFRVGSHRDGADGNGPAVENLARARVVVSNERD